MPTLADLVASYTRTPSATCYLDGQRWYGATKFAYHQKFKEQIETGSVSGSYPPVIPRVRMDIRWTWGYNGVELAGFTGYVTDAGVASYPFVDNLQCSGVLWLADQNNEVLQTDPLNEILASDAARYLLTHYGDIPASKLNLPSLPASGAAWAGGEWTLGILTPVQWGDVDQQSGGTTAMKAAAEIYGGPGYWLYATPSGVVTAKQMERRPSSVAREVFARNVNLLVQGAPERRQSYADVFNRVTVRGANTGVDGAQLYDQWRTNHPLLGADTNKDFSYSSFLLEYENAGDAGAVSITEVAKRILKIVSRVPDVVPLRAKANPARNVGDTVAIVDTGIRLATPKNYFIYQIDRSLDLQTGAFDDALLLDGGTGSTGYTTVPPPDASFSWQLMAETLDGDAVVEVFLDGSGSNSPSGEIVSWAWSTSTPTYSGTPNTATGVHAMFIFPASDSPASITLTVTDTTSKTGTFSADVDLSGADTQPPFQEVVSAAAGAAWYVTPDGGATWHSETSNGDAVAVGTIGAGADDRGAGTGATYGLLATRGSGGAGGLRQTLDLLATASTNLVSNAGAPTSNIWVNEANPSRVWFAIGSAVYRSTDGGATKVAMAAAPDTVAWIMEDAAVENSVFILSGADLLNATDPTVGWALLYEGPIGATARQFVRSRDGQVTWICYTGAPAGEALQRVETGAAADIAVTDIQTLALDRQASSLRATLYAITADDPAQIWSFDGLTGLNAAQSTQFFPAGATVQHMLSSRQFDVIYCADFNSIASGQGALRKLFPLPDQLLLWKALASGQQGTMLGLGSGASISVEIILIARNASGAADAIFRYQHGAWGSIALPSANKYWIQLVANPFNPDTWLLFGNSDSTAAFSISGGVVKMTDGSPMLYYTADAGASWTAIDLPDPGFTPIQILDLSWSKTSGDAWYIAAQNNSTTTALWRGSGTTAAAAVVDTTTVAYLALIPGLEDEIYFPPSAGGSTKKGMYVDSGNVWHTPSGSSTPGNVSDADYAGLSRNVACIVGSDLYTVVDYRSAQPLFTGLSGGQTVCYCNGLLFLGNSAGVKQISDPFGSPSLTTVTNGLIVVETIRSDRQTQTRACVRIEGTTSIKLLVYDGASWLPLDGPAAADPAALSPYLEVVVRP